MTVDATTGSPPGECRPMQSISRRPAPVPLPDCHIRGIAKAIRTIRHEYHRPLSVAALARECGMSVRTLHRLYRAATGNTIAKDLIARRIEVAARMLSEDGTKLEAVALETGLRNAKNLCRLFKERLGTTPGRWKQTHHVPALKSA